MPAKILYVANTGFSLYHFRLPMMKHLLAKGWRVVAAASDEADFQVRFEEQGIKFVNVFMDHKGRNPLRDLALVAKLKSLYDVETPDIVHHFTIKPVIFGSLAAKIAGVPAIINTITGLGYAFERGGLLRRTVIGLYRLALSGRPQVIFQNKDDHRSFISQKIVRQENAWVIPGSGVNTEMVIPVAKRNSNGSPKFLMVCRMLWSKGVHEYVQAAEIVKARYPETSFAMVGGASGAGAKGNPEAIPEAWLNGVTAKGAVTWLGRVSFAQVMELLDSADVFVAPSYYPEGIPRSIIEAAAKAKPIITTDTPGCREAVIEGINGFLVPPRDVPSLATRMLDFVHHPEISLRLGRASREMAVSIFDERKILAQNFAIYGRVIPVGAAEVGW